MEGRAIGVILMLMSTTLISSLSLSPTTSFIFLSLVIAGAFAYQNGRYWRGIVLLVGVAYLAVVLPSLIKLSSNGGALHVISVITKANFHDGVTLERVLVYWHLLLMPLAVALVELFLLVRLTLHSRGTR